MMRPTSSQQLSVIPAKAGIHSAITKTERGNVSLISAPHGNTLPRCVAEYAEWIPAFAGMTHRLAGMTAVVRRSP
jgi:hypothetical protein